MKLAVYLVALLILASMAAVVADVSSNVREDDVDLGGRDVPEQNEPQSSSEGGYDFRASSDKRNYSQPKESGEKAVNYEEELKMKQAEALRQRKVNGRKQDGLNAAKRTIHAASSDSCDWKVQPIAFIKGDVCGSHYKVLGIDRKSKLADKPSIKKKFRQLSLQLHPDKNPAPEAEDAFHVLQGAYDCILDDSCKEEYDQKLIAAEEIIQQNRQRIKRVVMEKSIVVLNQAHYYVSLAATRVYQLGMNFWEMLGEWQVTIFDESYPLGRPLGVLLLLWKGQFLLKLHALSYVIIRVNYEIAKARGWT
jgi:hypothetical protein